MAETVALQVVAALVARLRAAILILQALRVALLEFPILALGVPEQVAQQEALLLPSMV
jgi:hypothetical protein